ncbi:unnamed protein product, partial [Rotaria sordida]
MTTGKLICTVTNPIFDRYTAYGNIVILGKILPISITFLFGCLAYRNVQQLSHRTLPLVRRQLDKQLTVMVLVQVIVAFFTVLPNTITYPFTISPQLTRDPFTSSLLQFINSLTICLSNLYVASPFYIYLCASDRFRRQLILTPLNNEQRLHELQIQSENRQDALFANYLTEMGSFLLRETNGSSLSNDPKMAVLVQAKTLHVIRQIDVVRKRQLIAFLYVSGQLYVNRDPINLFGADLNNIDLQGHPILQNISLAGTYINNASFIGQDLSHADLSGAQINGGNFDGATCQHINFDYSHLNRSTFVGANCVRASFRHAYLYDANFRETKVMDTNFDDAYLVNVDFSHSNLTSSSFIRTNLAGAVVNKILIEHTMKFIKTNLAGIDFTRVKFSNYFLSRILFADVNLVNSSFKGVKLEYVNFYYCNMTSVDFSSSTLSRIEFKGSTL